MRKIAVSDAETDPFLFGRVPRPFAWGYYDGVQYREWWNDHEGYIAFLKSQPVICYAHNGGKFDWHFTLADLNPYDDIMIINGRIAKCYIGVCECRDSYNILPVPLAAYKKDKIDYKIMEASERNKPHNKKKIREYLKSDCVYLYELIQRFIQLYGIQITQASAALNQWKKISGNKPPQSTKEFYDAFSPYYYGGRVECFESGIINTDFSVYDINSAYPFAMQNLHPYSGEFSRIEKFVPDADFYRVRCVSRGAFPYRGEGNPGEFAGLRFPSDGKRRNYYVTGWEYDAAIETKQIKEVEVLESVTFVDHVDFKEYIEHFYNMRLLAKAQKNEAESLFAKLLMNSLYGKFAANPENYRNYMIVPMDVIPGLGPMGWSFAGELGPWALAEAPLDDEQKRYYNVATGASITGFVRAMLLRAIATSRGVMYCDTDSIAVRQKGSALPMGEKLGQWKFEGSFDKAGIAGKKLYIFRGIPDRAGHRKFKTASKGARLTHAQLWEVAAGGIVISSLEAPKFSASASPDFAKLEKMSAEAIQKKFFTQRRIRYTAKKGLAK